MRLAITKWGQVVVLVLMTALMLGCRAGTHSPRGGRERADAVTGRLVIRDDAGRDRIVLDPLAGISMLDAGGDALVKIWIKDGGAVMEIGRWKREAGQLPGMTYSAVRLGKIGDSAYCIISDASGSVMTTTQHGVAWSKN